MSVFALVTASVVVPVPAASAHEQGETDGGVSLGCGESFGAVAIAVEPEDAGAAGSSRTARCELQVSIDREIGQVGSVGDIDGTPIGSDNALPSTACRVVAEPTVTATSITVAVAPDGDCDGVTVRVDVYDQRWTNGAAGRVSDSAPAMLFETANLVARELGSMPRPMLSAFTNPAGNRNHAPDRLASAFIVTSGAGGAQPAPTQASNTAGAGEARTIVWAEDVVHATLVETESRLSWQFDRASRVWGGGHRSFYRKHSSFWDDLVAHSGGLVHRTGGIVDSYYSWALGEWHSDGFPHSIMPDVDHTQIAYAYGYASGGHSCSMSYSWDGAGAYPNLHVHMSCLRTR